jgi:UDP-N-acetylmuramoylalanine--D-glutamate ligase
VISEIEFAAFHKSSYDRGDRKQWKDDYNHVDLSFKSAGLNIGLGKHWKSFALQVANDTYDSYILEGSFQLDGIVDYKPHIAIITNISRII